MVDPKTYSMAVREQYEQYPFPQREPEDESRRLVKTASDILDKVNHYCFAGKQSFDQGFRTLVAGAGTGDASIFLAEQLRDRKAEVVHLDLSEESIGIAKARARVRGLTNVQFIHASLLDVADLELGTFDYINCNGVLHHLEDPEAGLRALRSVLNEDGAMALMLYGKYGRTGIYQVQEMLRMLFKEESIEEKIALTEALVEQLPESNWFKKAEDLLQDHKHYGDIGIYDMFLHSQDRAYTVPEVYDYVESAGLHFVVFSNSSRRVLYNPATYVRDTQILQQIAEHDLPIQQAIAELIAGNITSHEFYASLQEASVATADNLDMVPFYPVFDFSDIAEHAKAHVGKTLVVEAPDQLALGIRPNKDLVEILQKVDGKNSLREICNNEEQQRIFRGLLAAFSKHDWLLLRHKDVRPVGIPDYISQPVQYRSG